MVILQMGSGSKLYHLSVWKNLGRACGVLVGPGQRTGLLNGVSIGSDYLQMMGSGMLTFFPPRFLMLGKFKIGEGGVGGGAGESREGK